MNAINEFIYGLRTMHGYEKGRVGRRLAALSIALGLGSMFFAPRSHAAVPVQALTSSSQPAAASSYILGGQSYRFGLGNDVFLETATVTTDEGLTVLRKVLPDKQVKIRRVEANSTGTNAANVKGNRLYFQYEGGPDSAGYALNTSQMYSMSEVFASARLNIGAGDLFCNEGIQPNNIERIDFIIESGLIAPGSREGLGLVGYLVSERLGNNAYTMAAITSLDANGDPATFGPLFHASADDYGPGLYTPDPYYQTVRTPRDSSGLGLLPAAYFFVNQSWYGQFNTLADLGLQPGDTYYGMAMFPSDASDDMDLVRLTDVPMNTSDNGFDCGDHFGDTGLLMSAAARGSLAGLVWNDLDEDGELDDFENGLAGVSLDLLVDIDGNGVIDDADRSIATTATDDSGNYTFKALFPGDYYVVVTDTGEVLQQYSLVSGQSPLAVALGASESITDANFGYRQNVQIGLAKELVAITRVEANVYDVEFRFYLENLDATVAALNVQLIEDLFNAFPGVGGVELRQAPVISGGLSALNPDFDGNDDDGANPTHLQVLAGNEALPAGETATVQMIARVTLGNATGPFENQARMTSSASPNGFVLDEDLSDDGISSVPAEGGNPSGPGADDPTPIPLVAEPSIGVAKEASEVVVNPDGSFSTTFSFLIRNLGNTPLYDVQLEDDLASNFGTVVSDVSGLTGPGTYVVRVNSTTAGGLSVNPGYDGSTDTGLFDIADNASLQAGEQISLSMAVRFVPDPAKPSPLYNQAIATGDLFVNDNGTVDGDARDLSDDGLNELSPNSVGENDPTPVAFDPTANIGLAKAVAEISADTYPNLVAKFTLAVENLGSQRLVNVQVSDDLLATFPEAAATIVSVTNLQASGGLVINSSFDGQNDKNLLAAGSEIFPGSAGRQTIQFDVTFNLKTLDQEFYNQAYATATDLAGIKTTDDYSDSGTVVDADGDGNPNEEGENDPTPLGIPAIPDIITVSKSASRNEVTVGDVLTYRVRIKNNIPQALNDLEVVDIAPPGFNLKEGTVRLIRAGADNVLGTGDDVSSDIVPTISGRADMRFPSFGLAANEWVEIRYLMQVTTGVIAGDYYNRAYLEDNADIVISNVVAAGVSVVQDPLLQKTTIIGKVFHDRDGDGHQDNGDATGVYIDSPQFVGGMRQLGDLRARVRDSDPLNEHQVQLKAPHHAFTIRTKEGGVFRVARDGQITTDHTGDVRKGFNSQDIRVEFSHDGLDPLITITNVAVSEEGLPGVRLATVGGLLIETDLHGRYHIADVDTGRDDRSGLFVVKVDSATLPDGSVFTTENPRVLRLGKSLMTRFNFGVRLPDFDVAMQDVKIPERYAVRETVDMTGLIPDVLFDSGKADIRPDADRILRATVNTLRGTENIRLDVIGHTDSQRLSDSTQYKFGSNYGLGQARADAVAGYLQSHLGLVETNARPYTWGEEKPIASNKTPDGMQQNRRAEVNPVFEKTSIKTRWHDRTIRIPHGGVIWATEDPLKLDPRLAIEAAGPVIIDAKGQIQPLDFRLYSNYLAYLSGWKVEVFSERDLDQTKPMAVIKGDSFNNQDAIRWDAGELAGKVHAGDKLNYRLKVFNGEGNFDETYLRDLAVVDQRLTDQRLSRGESLMSGAVDGALSNAGGSQLVRQTIPLNGSRVRLHGADLHRDYSVTVNGQKITIDENNRFVLEQQMPVGQHRFNIAVTDSKGLDWTHEASVDVRGEYLFMVGLANLTVGQNSVSGNVEPLNGDEHYDESTFVDGRAAFYLKGKVKGKYLVTAQLDTTEDQLKNLGDNLKAKDPGSLLRALDADTFYPVYGDDSTTISDVDSQGAFYVRVDWDKSQALWGNFQSGITGNEFAQYNRTLYGAQLLHRTTSINRWGDHETQWNVFASEAQTAMGHNRFLATGGSLYYLREQDVVRGSEKVWVEVRERGSERVLESVNLTVGVDYEIDYLQGRILLSKPLSQTSHSRVSVSSLVTDQALDDNQVVLMTDFEYIPDGFSGDEVTAGVRGKHWLNDYVAIGGTYIGEERKATATDYRLAGLDLTLKSTAGTWLKAEYAGSEATQTQGGWLSTNGGLSFDQIQIAANDNRDGEALSLEGQVNLADLSAGDLKGRIAAWYKDRDAGFSTARSDDGTATTDYGLQVDWEASDVLRLSLAASSLEKTGATQVRKDDKVSLQARVRSTEKLDLIAEVSKVDHQTSNLDMSVSTDSEATLAAVGVEYRVNEHAVVSASAQTVIDDNGRYDDNDRITLGARNQVSDRLALKGEVSTGDRGEALQLGAHYRVSQQFNVQLEAGIGDAATSEIGSRYYTADGTELYGSYAVSGDRTDLPGESITLGQRKRIGATEVFVEERFTDNDREAGVAHVFGIQHQINREVAVTGGVQHSTVEAATGADIKRDVASIGVRYKDKGVKLSSRLEYRKDESNINDDGNATQWVTANAGEWQVSPHLKWLVRMNFARTESDITGALAGKFIEGDIGVAFRPAFSDRLNMLAKYSHLHDLPSLGQDTFRADEKAHVLSFEGLYDLNQRWEVGGKLALRKGEVREDRNGAWFDSGANLALVRTRYHFVKRWDALAEYRVLSAESGDDRRHGGLVGIYRHLGRNLRIGLGHNFTEFDDDLTRLDYDSKGWFIDIVGQF